MAEILIFIGVALAVFHEQLFPLLVLAVAIPSAWRIYRIVQDIPKNRRRRQFRLECREIQRKLYSNGGVGIP